MPDGDDEIYDVDEVTEETDTEETETDEDEEAEELLLEEALIEEAILEEAILEDAFDEGLFDDSLADILDEEETEDVADVILVGDTVVTAGPLTEYEAVAVVTAGPILELDEDGNVIDVLSEQTEEIIYASEGRIIAEEFIVTIEHPEELESILIEPDPGVPDIDEAFIRNQEGGQRLVAYRPDAGQSGVTVATGFDIGQRNAADLDRLGLSEELKDKLAPYLGLKGDDAEDYLNDHPLVLTPGEANEIDQAVQNRILAPLIDHYNSASDDTTFTQLPESAQTVILDVAYQYQHLWNNAPTFWGYVTDQNWPDAIHELRNFGDDYPGRRGREADLLQHALDNGEL